MRINKISLQNFRQFAGKQEIEFSTDADRNVTVVMGDNGTGKTTLAQAFLWCLYGTTDFTVKEVINRDIREAMTLNDEETVKVELYITRDIDGSSKLYRVTRRQKFKRMYSKIVSSGTEFMVAEKDENKGEWRFYGDGQARVFLKQTMPMELSRFFFFDGERIEELSKEINDGKSKEFKNAVQGLVGLTAMLNAINHMKPSNSRNTVIGAIQKDIDSKGSTDLREISKKIAEYDEIIDKNKPLIDDLDKQIKTYQDAIKADQEEIFQLSDAIKIKSDYENTERQINAKQLSQNTRIRNIFAMLSDHCYELLSMPLTRVALQELEKSDKLEKGVPYLHVDTLRFLLERGKCLCGADCPPGSDCAKQLYDLMDVALPKTIGQSIGGFADNSKNRIRNAQSFLESVEADFVEIRTAEIELEALRAKATNLFNQMIDTSRAQTLKDEINNYSKTIGRLQVEKGRLQEQYDNAVKKKGYAEEQRDNMMLIDSKNQREKLKLTYAKYVYKKLKTVYENKESETRQKLEDSINHLFTTIYDDGIRLEIDKYYSLKVTVTDTTASGDELDRNTAQNYAIIFAFISAILKLAYENSKEKDSFGESGYPLVMDAPLSAFDKKRISNICDTIPTIAQQVIIFIKDTDGDIAEEYMSEQIGKKYMLSVHSKTQSTIERRD